MIELLQEWFNTLAGLLGRAEAVAFTKDLVLWGLSGAVIGLGLSLSCYLGFRRARWYWTGSQAVRWSQRGTLALVTLLVVPLFGLVGLLEGFHRYFPSVLRRATAASPELHDWVGELTDGVFEWSLGSGPVGPDAAQSENLVREYRAGRQELDVPALLRNIDAVSSQMTEELVDDLESRMLARAPELGLPSFSAKILRRVIRELGAALVTRKAEAFARENHVEHLYHAVRHQLLAEAARTGNPATISRADLSAFLIREGLVPAVVSPVRNFVRQQQWICGIIGLAVLPVPAAAWRICRPRAAPPPLPVPVGA